MDDGRRTYGSVRMATAGFGLAYLIAFALLGDLLGSSADSTATFTEHFADDSARWGDFAGGLVFVTAALFLVAAGLTLRQRLASETPALKVDMVAGLALLAAGGLLVSAGLLLTVPATLALGDITDDTGIEPGPAAGIAQAGTVVLIATVLCLGALTALVAHVAGAQGAIGRWLSRSGWVVAVLTLAGWTGAAALPLGVWWLALAFRWRHGGR